MQAFAVDPDGVKRGQLEIVGNPSAVFRDADVGTWTVTVDGKNPLARRMVEDWGVLIVDGPLKVSGPWEKREYTTGATRDLVFSGVSELYRLGDDITYPNPGRVISNQDVARWTRKGAAETVIRDLVRLNVGPDALTERQSPGLAVLNDLGRGSVVTIDTRLKPVLDEAKAAARAGGVTFDMVRASRSSVPLTFRVPRDLRRSVRFTKANGGAGEGTLGLEAPTCTVAIVAAQGEGAERDITQTTAPASAWRRRIAVLKDRRDTSDSGAIDQTGADAIREGAGKATASFKAQEVPGHIFGTDFLTGDIVTVVIDGVAVSQPVRAAEVTWGGHGRTVDLTLGDTPEDGDPEWLAYIHDLEARVARQEGI